MIYLIIGFTLMSALLIYYSLLFVFIVKPKAIDRIDVYVNPNVKKKEIRIKVRKEKINVSQQITRIIALFGKGVNNVNFMTRIKENNQKQLIKADILLKGEEFIVIQIFSGLLMALIFFIMTRVFLVAILFSFIGFLIPMFVVQYKKNKRIKKFNDQLGDTIVLISNSLKVGHSFAQSIGTAAKEMPEPISKEFSKLIHEMRLGVSTETAFENLLGRVESDDLSLLITAVNIQRQTGGNLAEILDTIAKTIRERVKIKGEIRTLTSQGRLSGIIVTLLPFAIAGGISFMDPHYFEPLYKTKIGLVLLVVAFVNEIIGYVIINKIVKIDF